MSEPKDRRIEKGTEVIAKWKGMDIHCKVVDYKWAFGRYDYRLELLDDGQQTDDWVSEHNIEVYNG